MRSALIIFLFVVSTIPASAQQVSFNRSADTDSSGRMVLSTSPDLQWKPLFFAPRNLSDSSTMEVFSTNPLRFALLSQPAAQEKRLDLLWSQGFRKSEDPLRTFRIVVGYMEAGGSLYLAYKVLKEHGFLK